MGYYNFITYGGFWTHQIEFCINFTIFPGLKMPLLIAWPVKAEKNNIGLDFCQWAYVRTRIWRIHTYFNGTT